MEPFPQGMANREKGATVPRIYGDGQRPVPLPPALYQRALVRAAIQAGIVASQTELARLVGTTQPNLSRWLAGRQPRSEMAERWMSQLQRLELTLATGAKLRREDWAAFWEDAPDDARARLDLHTLRVRS